ncbi:helix-turn-helix domain-containing protein [Amycolatopsis viridis]|uniref:DNA-binding CsgD family transcriptional regulator n=1 Tax=Amycolatopsis viridis TaxID=185678 RepID=A0ABX0SNB5_9PSEU|nr:LuxR C-terminal-related transcriptional regulator [Amycolatopsis viridis]NIH78469.1 DNA-binding CsgD family transcriptional regulator [Amycolatopsis viridis]
MRRTTGPLAPPVVFTGPARADQFAAAMAYCAESRLPVLSARYGRGHATILTPGDVDADSVSRDFAAHGLTLRAEPADIGLLSARERDLLGCFAAGMQMKEAARAMGVTTNTVREYWLRAKRKLGVRSVAQAAALWSLEFGLTEWAFPPAPARAGGRELVTAAGGVACR